MNRPDVIRSMDLQELSVYTKQQMAAILKVKIASAGVILNRMIGDGEINRITNGKYCLSDSNILGVASNLYAPSYVSLLSAFEYYDRTTQTPRIIDVVNVSHSGTLDVELSSGRYSIRLIKTGIENMFGYRKTSIDGKTAFVANLEKAVLDGLIFNYHISLDVVVEAIESNIDVERTIEYLVRTGKQAIIKRGGYLLEAAGYGVEMEDIGISLSATYVPLDPSLPMRGKYNTKWKIIDNRGI